MSIPHIQNLRGSLDSMTFNGFGEMEVYENFDSDNQFLGNEENTEKNLHYLDCLPGPSQRNRMDDLELINEVVAVQHSSSEDEIEFQPTPRILPKLPDEWQYGEEIFSAGSDWEGDLITVRHVRRNYIFAEQEITQSDLDDLENESDNSAETLLTKNDQESNAQQNLPTKSTAGPSSLNRNDDAVVQKPKYIPALRKVKRKQKINPKQNENSNSDESDVEDMKRIKPRRFFTSKRLKLAKTTENKFETNTHDQFDSEKRNDCAGGPPIIDPYEFNQEEDEQCGF